jgi:threonine synthase
MFNDFAFRDRVRLAGVNSINWARVLAQVVYYFTSAVALGAPHRAVSFTVPTGNFGDIFAGYIAKRMGLPIEKLVVATNQNDILHRCAVLGGAYVKDGVTPRSARRWTSRSAPISSARCSTPMGATAARWRS